MISAQEVRARGGRFRDGGSYGQSFSSSLLDEIYRSIDDGGDKRSGELKFYRHDLLKKQGKSIDDGGDKRIGELKFYSRNVVKKQGKSIEKTEIDVEEDEIAYLHRALLIERWIEKKVAQRRRSLTEPEVKFHDREEDALFFSSTSSSSDSSFGFSSSDTESIHASKSLKPSCFAKFRPKPVRTSVSAAPPEKKQSNNQFIANKESRDFDENAMIKSKSRALKIYSNLKKMKQPISPGGRLTTFLNSIFTAGTPKKQSQSTEDPKSKSGQTSTCSSAASFSRSCLSKNSPCSSEKLRNADRRTVRFHPVSTIVDEYCKPCGHKSLHEEQPPFHVKNNLQTVPNRKILTDYHHIKNDFLDHYEEEDDDSASCSSSDLFELDHLTARSGGDRYYEELPVYESTTRVDSNRPIRHR